VALRRCTHPSRITVKSRTIAAGQPRRPAKSHRGRRIGWSKLPNVHPRKLVPFYPGRPTAPYHEVNIPVDPDHAAVFSIGVQRRASAPGRLPNIRGASRGWRQLGPGRHCYLFDEPSTCRDHLGGDGVTLGGHPHQHFQQFERSQPIGSCPRGFFDLRKLCEIAGSAACTAGYDVGTPFGAGPTPFGSERSWPSLQRGRRVSRDCRRPRRPFQQRATRHVAALRFLSRQAATAISTASFLWLAHAILEPSRRARVEIYRFFWRSQDFPISSLTRPCAALLEVGVGALRTRREMG